MAIPAFEVEFDKQGKAVDARQLTAAIDGVAQAKATDLLVLAHGWNNDIADARALYASLLARIEAQKAAAGPDRVLAACEVFWPSKKFTAQQLIPGGAAGLGDKTLAPGTLAARLDELKTVPERLGIDVVDPRRATVVEQLKALVPALEKDVDAQRRFVELVRSLPPGDDRQHDDASEEFFATEPVELLRSLSRPLKPPLLPKGGGQGGGAAISGRGRGAGAGGGGAAGVGDFFQGMKAAANRLLNYLTYYEMKRRAGLVGTTGVAAALRQVHQRLSKLKLHLVGHSFGGRLVTAATDALGPDVPLATLTLLQAAYSHNGLAATFDGKHDGFFRHVLSPQRKVSGPILITNTKNDLAVGIAYPLASRLSGDTASALGDRNDPYGGMGRNGAQRLKPGAEIDTAINFLDAVGTKYAFHDRVYNLNADAFIKDHSDISKDEVAYALLRAVATT
jgi:pimeloyl-ACP methyl ester carboxylesterase